MRTHSSVLAWRMPGMVEPGGLLSLGWHRVGHDWSDLAATAAVAPYTLGNPVHHFLLCYEHLEAEKTRLYPSSSPGVWLLLEFGQWWTKEIGESVEKEISGLILSWLLSCCEVAKFLHWSPELCSEVLAFGCSYVQDSLETAISILFRCPVGLKVFMYLCSCLSQRVLLFLLSYP